MNLISTEQLKEKGKEPSVSINQMLSKRISRKFPLDENFQSVDKKNAITKTKSKRKRGKKPYKWTVSETQFFYDCIELFGLDFFLIQQIFCHKTKRQLLRKYHKEKKVNSSFIEEALKKHESSAFNHKKRYKYVMDRLFTSEDSRRTSVDHNSDKSLDKVIQKKFELIEKSKKISQPESSI